MDLIELDRVARALARWGDRLVARLMDRPEASRLPEDEAARARALAMAIAGKEAAAKALGTGWSQGVRWRDVEVDLRGPVRVRLQGGAIEAARRLRSSGRTWASLEVRDGFVLGQVRLLA